MTASGLRYVVVDRLPRAPVVPKPIAKQITGPYNVVAIAGANAAIVQRTELGEGTLVVVANGRAKRCKEPVYGACIRRDGTAAYAIANQRVVVRCMMQAPPRRGAQQREALRSSIDEASIFTVFAASDRLVELALIDDRYLFAGGRDQTDVIDLEHIQDGSFATLAGLSTWVRPHTALGSIRGGRVVWLRHGNDRKTLFVTITDGKLVRLGTLDVGLEVMERGDQLFGRTHFDRGRIDGLDELIASRKPRTPVRAGRRSR